MYVVVCSKHMHVCVGMKYSCVNVFVVHTCMYV